MLRFAITAAVLLLAGSANSQSLWLSEEPYWTPDAATIAKLEAGLRIPHAPGGIAINRGDLQKQAAYQLTQYDRYYAGVTLNGQRVVRGRLIVPPNREDNPKTGTHITDVKYMPELRGGGCANVFVRYVVDQDFSVAQCNMTEVQVPPSEQPHWSPDEQTAALMEVTIQDLLNRTHPDLPGLWTYSRYYWGVTIDRRRTIRGRIVKEDKLAPGMYLASDWDNGPFFSDGGCRRNITSTYDVQSAGITQLDCEGYGGRQPSSLGGLLLKPGR